MYVCSLQGPHTMHAPEFSFEYSGVKIQRGYYINRYIVEKSEMRAAHIP